MNQKHVFWEALLLAIFIFASGMLLGYVLELNRTSKIISAYQEAELNLLDVRIQEEILSLENFDCQLAVKEIISFADKTYEDALMIENYEGSAKLSEGILFQYKKYSLLRAILWTNALKVKERCPNSFNIIVYFYEFDSDDLDKLAKQKAFSKFLEEIKEEYGNKVLLIPLAGNLNINSINLLIEMYDIKTLPSILVNEEINIETIENLENIRNFLILN